MISASTRRTVGPARPALLSAALSAVVALTATLLLGSPGGADAQAPLRMAEQVVDTARVFDEDDHRRINDAIDALYEHHQIQMWVVYVDDFDSMTPGAWAAKTSTLTDIGDRDLLLAVATANGRYSLTAPSEIEGLTQKEIDSAVNDALKPAVERKAWASAVVDTIDAVDDTAEGPSRTWMVVVVLIAAVLAAAAIAFLVSRRRSSDDTDSEDAPLTVDQLAGEPLDVLRSWADEALVAADNAVRTSVDELALASDELSDERLRPFADAVAAAQEELRRLFLLGRHSEPEAEPGNEAEAQRARLIEVITGCADIDAALDARVSGFDAARNLLADADDRLDALAGRLAETRTRLTGTEPTLSALLEPDAADDLTVATISDNLSLARTHVQFAEDSIEQGREAAGLPIPQRGPAGAAIRSAEAALDAADKLIDAVDAADRARDIPEGERDRARVQAAADYIDTRRGAVGADARAELADDRTRSSAERALTLALEEVERWRDGSRTHDEVLTATVLTGTLVDIVVPTAGGDDVLVAAGKHGYNTGGRSPGSFGGSTTSGRIGTGARF